MKKVLNNLITAIGIVIICASLFGYGLDKFGYLEIPDNKLPLIIIVVGIGIVISGVCDVFVKSNKEIKKELEIEANDERNVCINRIAKSFAFDIMTILFSITITLPALIGKISTSVFFIFFGIYVISQVAYIYKLRSLNNKM